MASAAEQTERAANGGRPLAPRVCSGIMRRAAAVLVVAALSAPAAAQGFGRNKVRWEQFDFRVLRTSHCDLHFYP